MNDAGRVRTKNRIQLIMIGLIFALPVVIAWILFTVGWRPAATTNHGELIRPPVPQSTAGWVGGEGKSLSPQIFKGIWTMLIVAPGACTESCMHALDQTGSVWVALGPNAHRAQRILLQAKGRPGPGQPRPKRVLAPRETVDALVGPNSAGDAVTVYLIDPQGLRMMRYPPPLDAHGLMRDLQHLLRISNEQLERLQKSEGH